MNELVSLKINDKKYNGWLSVSITLSMETLANAFQLGVTDNWIDQKKIWPIIPGDKAQILIGDEKIITGWVDSVNPKIDAQSRSIEVGGRDLAADLIDCSAELKGGQAQTLTLLALAKILAKPFGVTVKSSAPAGTAYPNISIAQGETVFEVLEKRARARGLLLVSNANGEVEIVKPGSSITETALIEGRNILSAQASFDARERFSKYTVRSQLALDEEGLAGYQIQSQATDPGVKRYRPLIIQAEAQSETGSATLRAQYEATVRAARSAKLTISVAGWRQTKTGALWKPNQLVPVFCPSIGVREVTQFLITTITYSLANDGGSITTFELKRKDAFLAEKLTDKADPWRRLYQKESGA